MDSTSASTPTAHPHIDSTSVQHINIAHRQHISTAHQQEKVPHGQHINNKLKELQVKVKIPSANISLFITNRKSTKQAWPHGTTFTKLSHKQPANNQAVAPPHYHLNLTWKASRKNENIRHEPQAYTWGA